MAKPMKTLELHSMIQFFDNLRHKLWEQTYEISYSFVDHDSLVFMLIGFSSFSGRSHHYVLLVGSSYFTADLIIMMFVLIVLIGN